MKKIKSLLCVVLAVVMVLSLAACGGKDSGSASNAGSSSGSDSSAPAPTPNTENDHPDSTAIENEEGRIRVRIGGTGSLGRFLGGVAPEENHSACNAVFDTILRRDPWTMRVKSDCLEDWYWEDENHFVMKLKDGVMFSNGTKATAEDVIFSYYSHEERGSNYLNDLYIDFDKTEARDELTAVFYVTQQNQRMAETGFMLISKAWAREVGWDSELWYTPVTSGPYECVEYVHDDYMVLRLREDYWGGSDQYYVEEYLWKLYPDSTTLFMELELGNIDLCSIPNADYSRFLKSGDTSNGINVCMNSTGSTLYANFGFKDNDIWYNKTLREAIAHAVNWDELGQLMMGDLYSWNNGFAALDGPSYYDAGTWEYNPDMAKELLAQCGYDASNPLTVQACLMDNPLYKNFGQGITFYLENVGVICDFQYADVSASIANWIVPGGNDINLMYSPSGNARKDVRGTLSQAAIFPGVSFTFIDEPHFQELYAKLADPKTSQEELWDTDHEIQQWIFDEALAMPICEYNAAFGYNSNLLSPEIFTPICFAERYMLRDLALKTTWGK